MSRKERGYSLAEMMIGLFAFSLILSSIMFLITRWQQTTSVTRLQRTLANEARDAMRVITNDVQEASYIYHWTRLNITIRSNVIQGHSAAAPYLLDMVIPAVTSKVFAPGADLGGINSTKGSDGLGEVDLQKRLSGTSTEAWSTLALASLSEGGLTRPRYVVYFAVKEEDSLDETMHVYRFQFVPNDDPLVDTRADTWHPMDKEFSDQKAELVKRYLTIDTAADGTGTIERADTTLVKGRWQVRRVFSTVNKEPKYADGLFRLVQFHPWSDSTPISPLVVEAVVVPAKRYGGRIVGFPLFGRAYARNVAMPSAK
ncbi:hypothetical protein D3C87_694140 [compost metagenome]